MSANSEELARERGVHKLLEAKELVHEAYADLAEGRFMSRGLLTPVCSLLQTIVDMVERDFDHYIPRGRQ